MDLGNPKNTIEVIQKYNFAFQKKFGQNFLIDTHVLDKIISAAGMTKEDTVLEVGPGIGTMTQRLSQAAGQVIAVEIDTNLIPILKDTLQDCENVTVINEDILKIDIKKMAEEKGLDLVEISPNAPCRTISRPRSSWGCLRAARRSTILRLWCRKRSQTGCRLVLARRITARCRWRFSIMPSHTSWQMCRRTVSFRVRMWAQRSSV